MKQSILPLILALAPFPLHAEIVGKTVAYEQGGECSWRDMRAFFAEIFAAP